jgi:hypothetical protein
MNFFKIQIILLFTLIVNGQGIVAYDKKVIFQKTTKYDRLFIGYIARLNYFQMKIDTNSLSSMEEKILNILLKVIYSQIKKYLAERNKWTPIVYWYSRQG